MKKTAHNTGFASGGGTSKLGALCFYSSLVLVDSFVLRNPPERKARKRCGPYFWTTKTNELQTRTSYRIKLHIHVDTWISKEVQVRLYSYDC